VADNSILPKAQSQLVDTAGRPTRAFYDFFRKMVNGFQSQLDSLTAIVATLAKVVASLGGNPDGSGIIDVQHELDAKVDKTTSVYGAQSLTGGGNLYSDAYLSLVGDEDAPTALSFYGVLNDDLGRGWQHFTDNFAALDDGDGNYTLDLADLADSGTGTFKLITRDAKGRVSGTADGTTDDVPEGSTNLYFTDARAQAAVVASSITEGDTTHSPSGDAVFDALTLKIDSSEKAAANGVATLGADAKLDPGQLPALAITETFVVDDEAEMLALDCQQGDVAVRTDESTSYILTAEPASTLSNWQELLTPTGGVTSFNGRTGSVTPASGDYTPAQVGAEPAITAGTTAQYWRGDKSWQTLDKTAVGLGNVDNTSDAGKPVSTAQQTALDAKQDAGYLTGSATIIRLHNSSGDSSGGAIWITSTPTFSYRIDGVQQFAVTSGGNFAPDPDNTRNLGGASNRWSVVYAATGSINTSDGREKTVVAPLTAAELAAAADLARAIGTYQWLASIATKGAEDARQHAGLTVQHAIEIMRLHGLDPMRYGFICYDQWPAEPAVIDPETGDEIEPAREAGDRYSFRHDELLLFLARGFAARLDALEAAA
jgi:hypothetical protein